MSKNIKASVFYFIAKFLHHFLNLFSIFFIKKSLLLDQIATINQVLIIIEISSVLLLGVPEAVLFFISKDRRTYSNLLINFVKKFSWLYLLLGLIFGLILPIYFSNPVLRAFILNYSVLLFSSALIAIFDSYLLAINRIIYSAVISIFFGLSKFILSLFLFFSLINFTIYINLYSLVYLSVSIVFVINLGIFGKKEIDLLNSSSKKIYLEIFLYAIPLWFSSILGTINKLIDKLMVGYFFSTSDFGLYSVLGRDLPYTIITAIFISLTSPTIIKLISNKSYNSAFIIWKKSAVISSFILIFAVFSNFLLVDKIISFLYSDSYLVGRNIFLIYLLNLLPHVAYWGIFSKAYMKTKFIFIISLVALISNVILNLILIPLFGLEGPALSTLIVTLIDVIAYVLINQKLTNKVFLSYFPIKEIFIFIIENSLIYILMNQIVIKTLFFNSLSLFLQLSFVAFTWFILLCILNTKLIYKILKNKL